MPILLDIGIQIVLFLQSLGGWLAEPMRLFTLLGNEEFFLMIMPVLYWCVDAGMGLRVGVMLLISGGLNGILKLAFQGPRPYFYDPAVQALSAETSFGLPSGHAQNSAAVWGLIAALSRSRTIWVILSALVLVIGISRLYLGVHFPTDVLAGWAIGAILVWGFMRLERPVVNRFKKHNLFSQVLIVLALSLLILFTSFAARASLGAWEIPNIWAENVAHALPDSPLPNPLALSGQVTVAGALFGLLAGALFLGQRGWFDAAGPLGKKLLRIPIGLLGVVLLWMGLGELLPRGETLLPLILRFLRYALVAAWMSAGAPLVYLRLGLAQPAHPPLASPSEESLAENASLNI